MSDSNESKAEKLKQLHAQLKELDHAKDIHTTISLLKQCAELDDIPAIYQLGQIRLYGVEGVDDDEIVDKNAAFFHFIHGAMLNDPECQFVSAQFYRLADKLDDAIELAKRAAQQDHVEAQFYLGTLFSANEETQEQALYWFEKAAENGNANAQYAAGILYDPATEGSDKIQKDWQKSRQYLTAAAEQNQPEAQYILGIDFSSGEREDLEKMRYWLHRAAEQELPQAQLTLALLHLTGKGVDHDYQKAYDWCKKAAESGCEDAENLLPQLVEIIEIMENN